MVERDARQDSGLKAICSSHRLKCTSVLKANMSSLGSAEATQTSEMNEDIRLLVTIFRLAKISQVRTRSKRRAVVYSVCTSWRR